MMNYTMKQINQQVAPTRADGADRSAASLSDVSARDFKAVFIIDRLYYDLGGTEGQVMKLVRGLSPRMKFELVVLEDGPWIREQQRSSGLDITIIDMTGGVRKKHFWQGFWQLVKHLKTTDANVVHTFFPISNIMGTLAARLGGIATVVGSRRDYGYWISPGYLLFTKLANRLVSRIVTNSPEVKRFTAQKEGFPLDRIEVIYNGLELDRLQVDGPDLALKAAIGIPLHHRVVTLVANYRPIKRSDTLVDALAVIARERDDVSVLFIGDPDAPTKADVDQFVAQRGLQSRVFHAHAKGDVERYLSFVDVGCNCSESEGLSNAVMEYMAAGVPCVVSNGGGNVDLIAHESNGLVFDVGDHQALARHILRILDDAALRQRFVDASLHRMQTEMSLPVIVDQFDRFYRRIASRPGG